MTDEKLLGIPVLINPRLADDPLNRQETMGFIIYADTERDEVNVKFPDGVEGLYSYDALLTLRNKHELFNDMMLNSTVIETGDFLDIYKIALLQDHGGNVDLWIALEIAKNNANIWEGTLSTLEDTMETKRYQTFSR